jgi:hypothetical protein
MSDISTGHSDGSLITDASNIKASRAWEGQLCFTVKDGSLQFLFENKCSMYHGCGFEMLAALTQHCHPDTVTNAFLSLLSLFNDVQKDTGSVLKYPSCFDGLTLELSQCKVVIPPHLLVMLFLQAPHDCYLDIVDWSCFKPIETTTIDLIVSDVTYHDGFTLVDAKKPGKLSTPGPQVPAALSANTNFDCSGKVWQSPWNWLAQYGLKGIKGRWLCTMAGTGIFPIYHWDEFPQHVPAQCPLLKEIGFMLVTCTLVPPTPAPPALATSLSSQPAATEVALVSETSGLASAPSGLLAVVEPVFNSIIEYGSKNDFCWDGNKNGVEYGVDPPKLRESVPPYSLPSCSHASVVQGSGPTSLHSCFSGVLLASLKKSNRDDNK